MHPELSAGSVEEQGPRVELRDVGRIWFGAAACPDCGHGPGFHRGDRGCTAYGCLTCKRKMVEVHYVR